MNRSFNPVSLLIILLLPVSSSAHHILFYYNHMDSTDGGLLACVTILQKAGHRVTAIDVAGRQHDPEKDNWGAPYDQVWDMRFVDRDKDQCGTGSPVAADYFDQKWRTKAVAHLNHCGRLFIAAEHYQMADRDEGIYEFLSEIQAVKAGFDSCPPSGRGNSTTNDEVFYQARPGLGPASFFGAYVGGIPLAYLNGMNFVDTSSNWHGEDGVDRSIVSGWDGSRMAGTINAPPRCRGKLFMVWDATMWSLWSPDIEKDLRPNAPLDENSWFSWDSSSGELRDEAKRLRKARKVTAAFFPAIAQWLGSSQGCPCAESESYTGSQAFPSPIAAPLGHQTITFKSDSTLHGKSQLSIGPTPGPGIVVLPEIAPAPQTLVFRAFPVNLYMRFLDGPGRYQLDIWDSWGGHVKTIYLNSITVKKEDWATWDGMDDNKGMVRAGNFYAVLSKEGKFLKKIILSWNAY